MLTSTLGFVLADPDAADEETRARRPLAQAEIQARRVPGELSMFRCKLRLRPHYQLTPADVTLRVVSLPPRF